MLSLCTPILIIIYKCAYVKFYVHICTVTASIQGNALDHIYHKQTWKIGCIIQTCPSSMYLSPLV